MQCMTSLLTFLYVNVRFKYAHDCRFCFLSREINNDRPSTTEQKHVHVRQFFLKHYITSFFAFVLIQRDLYNVLHQ